MTDADSHTAAIPRLKFADEHIEPILAGRKTATIRIGLDFEEYKIGHRAHFCDTDGERFFSVIIDDRGTSTVNWIANHPIEGHRDYRDAGELIEELERYYPEEKPITGVTQIDILRWDWEDLWE